jgi:hypothetical protein
MPPRRPAVPSRVLASGRPDPVAQSSSTRVYSRSNGKGSGRAGSMINGAERPKSSCRCSWKWVWYQRVPAGLASTSYKKVSPGGTGGWVIPGTPSM